MGMSDNMRFSEMVNQIRKDNMWESKANYVSNLMFQNAQNPNLTESQHEVLRWLCKVRHEMHSNRMAFWNEEYPEHNQFWNYISDEINNRLNSVGFPSIDFGYSEQDYITESTYEYDFDDENSAIEWLYEKTGEWNTKIELFLNDIDENYGTNYCPTGNARLY